MDEPLTPPAARKLIRSIVAAGNVVFTRHARDEMAKDALTEDDIMNTLRGGWVEPGEWENGSWRYRVCTHRIVAVVAFRSESEQVVVTAWRLR